MWNGATSPGHFTAFCVAVPCLQDKEGRCSWRVCDITRTFDSILCCCALLSEKAGDQGQEGHGVCSEGATSLGLFTVQGVQHHWDFPPFRGCNITGTFHCSGGATSLGLFTVQGVQHHWDFSLFRGCNITGTFHCSGGAT